MEGVRHSSPCRALVQDNHRQPLLTSTLSPITRQPLCQCRPIEGEILNVCLIALFLIHHMTVLEQFFLSAARLVLTHIF